MSFFQSTIIIQGIKEAVDNCISCLSSSIRIKLESDVFVCVPIL